MNNYNLFNVAVTRARRRQVIFTGLDARHLPPEHLLGRYLDYAGECLEPDRPEDHTDGGTAFEREIGQALRQRDGYEVYIGYPVAGFAVDVVAQYGGRALAIACDGDPERHAPIPGEVSLDTVNGQTILERAGWQVHRLSLRRWQREREQVLAEIDAMLGVEREDEEDEDYDEGEGAGE